MRFVRVEVQNFRAIRRATVDFGPGLNVLFGPNDLGKTTLASAMRAALLLPADSSAHQAFLPWQSAEPTTILLCFEAAGSVWRVHKTFGSGSSASARLECSPDGSSFHEEAKGRAVERRVRELLGWGIEAPGGKTGPRGLPESFLSHVLLAGQSDAPELLARSLDGDRDDSGRQNLHRALQSLAQDPVFKRVLEAAQTKVDSAFTAKGRRRIGQGTPFASLRDQINQLALDFERFSHQRRESEEVQGRVALLSDERLAAQERIVSLERSVAEGRAALAEREAQRAVRERHEKARQDLTLQLARQRELAELEARVLAAEQRAEVGASAARAVASALEAAEGELVRAEARVSHQTGDSARAERALQRAALDSRRAELAMQVVQGEEMMALESRLTATAAAAKQAGAELGRVDDALAELRAKHAAVDAAREQARRLTEFCQGREAAHAAERARAARNDAVELEAKARGARARSDAALAAARELAPLAPNVLAELRQLESERRVAAARLDVGLSMKLKLADGRRAELTLDGVEQEPLDGRREPQLITAKSQVRLLLAGAAEVEVAAGAPELRAAFEQLDRRWSERVIPLLAQAEVDSVEALATRSEQGRALQRQAEEARREAADLARRAEEKLALGADLPRWTERAERLLGAFDEPESAASTSAAAALGAGWEQALAERIALVEQERRSLARSLEEEAQRAAALRARSVELEHARQLAHGNLDAKRRALGNGSASLGAGGDLAANVARDRAALESASAALEAFELEVESELRGLSRRREEAAERVREVRAKRDSSEAASLAAREQHLELAAQLRERRLHFDPCAVEASRSELARSEAELAGLPDVSPVTAEQVEAAERELEQARARERQQTSELRRAEGALGQIGGDVAAERERQTQEALARARELEVDMERDYEGYRLLAETLRAVENEQGVHLGRALERPVSERFDRLTRGRYGSVELDAQLGLRGVLVAGEHRSYRDLSEGTQEQLATIVRLCIAEHLETALVLDDHLAQTHRQRAEWFRAALREAGQRIQVIVLTARPEDLLEAEELTRAMPHAGALGSRVRAVDLELCMERASYARRMEALGIEAERSSASGSNQMTS